MSSNFSTIAPKLKKQYTSGTFLGQGSTKSSINDNYNFQFSQFTSNIGVGESFYPFQIEQYVPFTTPQNYGTFTSNAMVEEGNFNIIKVDLHNTSNVNVELNVCYAQENDIRESEVKYTAQVNAGDQFYRNYPVENRHFSIYLKNLDTTHRAFVDGDVTLSRYTQYNTPGQIVDIINDKTLVNLDRVCNDFYDDVILGRVQGVSKVDRIGVTSNMIVTDQSAWNWQEKFDWATNSSSIPYAQSSSNADVHDITIAGLDDSDNYITDTVTLTGTMASDFTKTFKVVTDIRMEGTNAGFINIVNNSSTATLNYADAYAGRSTTLAYTPASKKAVVKDMILNGTFGLVQNTRFYLYKVHTSKREELIWATELRDNKLCETIPVDILVNEGEIIYGEYENDATFGDESRMTVKLNIVEYEN